VVGLWPESGDLRVVEIDAVALDGAVDRVVDTVAVIADAVTTPDAVRTADDAAGAAASVPVLA
jgi:hypothetical protein